MKYFLSMSPLVAGAFVGYLVAAAPAKAHTSETVQSATWVDANKDYCWAVCRAADKVPVISGHYGSTNLQEDEHYLVCRVNLTPTGEYAGRPGFNISSSKNRCRVARATHGSEYRANYQCLCQPTLPP
jgi:hypothetical protein